MVVDSFSFSFSRGAGRPLMFVCAAVLINLALLLKPALAHEHHHGAAVVDCASDKTESSKPAFMATTAKPFAALMDDAMQLMDEGMKCAPMNGQSEHDFMSMMIPHHQGAVDMAKAVLLYTKDPAVRNLALGIIAEQQNEIKLMQLWLQQHPQAAGK
ncbi:DUF305 domain-containing protein [Undibacterium sp. Tian12W]|uniref:DUF305 domain-containing protein n=1 Tax=Undibacterium sp. Tian12W TaxID=3413054 RepID=UPI003BF04910